MNQRDRHARNPISVRFPEDDENWLREYSRKTGWPIRRLIIHAVQLLQQAADTAAEEKRYQQNEHVD